MLHHRDRGADRAEAVRLNEMAVDLGERIGMRQLCEAAWPPRSPLDIGGAYRSPAPPRWGVSS